MKIQRLEIPLHGLERSDMQNGWEIAIKELPKQWKERPIYVSLNKRGEIAMNAEAFARIKEPASVTLLYDAGKRCVGVKYPVPADRNFFPVRRYGRGRKMRIVRAARMLKQFGIEVERTIVFQDVRVEMFRKEPMLVLELGMSS